MAVAVITGASRGFGLVLAERLATDGWNLVLDARGAGALDAAATNVRASAPGVTVRAIAGDVADPEHRRALVAAAWEIGGLDLLVNNASLLGPSPQRARADRAQPRERYVARLPTASLLSRFDRCSPSRTNSTAEATPAGVSPTSRSESTLRRAGTDSNVSA